MVKKLIKSIVGKKEDKEDLEDIPDELPPLAEDLASEDSKEAPKESDIVKEFKEIDSHKEDAPKKIVDSEEIKEEANAQPPKKEESKHTEKKDEEKPEPDDAKETIKEEEHEEKEKKEEVVHKEDTAKENKEEIKSPFSDISTGDTLKEKLNVLLPKEQAKVEKETIKEEKSILEKSIEIDKQKEKNHDFSSYIKKKEKGFFSELLELTELKGIPENLLKEDLFKRMKDYWYYHPQGKEKLSKENVEKDITNELFTLKRLEESWIAQKKFLEDDKRILLDKQHDIISKTKKLQLLLNQLRIYENVHPNNYFWLNNEISIKNLHELMSLLEVIDDKTFKLHVDSNKNDFSEWIKHAIGNHQLAEKIKPITNREEMLIILENAAIGNLYAIKPEQYFKMEEHVIRDLKELIGVLKETTDETYQKYANSEKNDFSNWVREVYKNDFLADKLLQQKTRKETIDLLEEFIHG